MQGMGCGIRLVTRAMCGQQFLPTKSKQLDGQNCGAISRVF